LEPGLTAAILVTAAGSGLAASVADFAVDSDFFSSLPLNSREKKLPDPADADDLEGLVAKRLADAYEPGKTRWWKVLNRNYSQKIGRGELFERRYG